MSTFSENKFNVSVELAAPYNFLIEHYFYDNSNNLQPPTHITVNKNERYNYQLKSGIYTFRVIFNGTVKDNLIVVDKPLSFGLGLTDVQQTVKIILPELYTSVPLRGKRYGHYNSSSDYIQALPQQNSDLPKSEYFTLMLRYPSKESYLENFRKQDLWASFSLLDKSMKLFKKIKAKTNAILNDEEGWMTAEIQLSEGIYFLLFECNKDSRIIPLKVLKGKNIFAFITLAETPKFGTLRILSIKEPNFSFEDPEIRLIDLLLDKLNNRDYNNSIKLLQYIYENTTNPFLLLIAKYLYVGSLHLNSTQVQTDKQIFDLLADNTKTSDYQSDEAAIKLILVEKGFLEIESVSIDVERPPTIGLGFDAVMRAATNDPGILKSFTLLDYMAENLISDSPYTTFLAPTNLLKKLKPLSFIKGNKFTLVKDENGSQYPSNPTITEFMGDKLSVLRRDIVLDRKDLPSILHELDDLLTKNPAIDINCAARELNVPKATLFRVLETERDRIRRNLQQKTVIMWGKRIAIILVFFSVGLTGFQFIYKSKQQTDHSEISTTDSTSSIGVTELVNGLDPEEVAIDSAVAISHPTKANPQKVDNSFQVLEYKNFKDTSNQKIDSIIKVIKDSKSRPKD